MNIEQVHRYSDVPEPFGFEPFIIDGSVQSVFCGILVPQSLYWQGVLPLYKETFLGGDASIVGCEKSCLRVLLHMVYLKCGLVTGFVQVGLRP